MLSEQSVSHLLVKLTNLGLTKYEALTYLALIMKGESTARELSEFTKIPYGKIYEIINSLCKKGFISLTSTKPLKCKAIEAELALENIKKKINNQIDEIKEIIGKNFNLWQKNERKEIGIIEGEENINSKILEILKSKKISIISNGMIRNVLLRIDKNKFRNKDITILLFDENDETKKEIKRNIRAKIKNITKKYDVCIIFNCKEMLIIEEFNKTPYSIKPSKAIYLSNTHLTSCFSHYLEEIFRK